MANHSSYSNSSEPCCERCIFYGPSTFAETGSSYGGACRRLPPNIPIPQERLRFAKSKVNVYFEAVRWNHCCDEYIEKSSVEMAAGKRKPSYITSCEDCHYFEAEERIQFVSRGACGLCHACPEDQVPMEAQNRIVNKSSWCGTFRKRETLGPSDSLTLNPHMPPSADPLSS